jgi:potassium efflux system protein
MMRVLLSLLIAICLLFGAERAAAQATQPAADAAQQAVDYDAWAAEAERAENLLSAGTASTSFFENLRATLVDWRTRFRAAADADAARIATIEAEIATLGPVPEDGSPEPDAIADRRASLNDRLAQARVPQITAATAFTRADGLIGEIDELLRDRQQQQLLQLDPSPMNPVNWATAVTALRDVVVTIDGQISNRVRDPVRRDTLVDNAPGIVALLLIGFLFVFRGRRWTTRLTERLQARTRSRGRTAVAFLVSLLQITVPLAGVLLLLAGVVSSGMIGPQTTAILESLAGLAVAVYVSLWLAGRLFRDDPEAPFALLRATPERAAAARRVTVSIGVTVGMAVVMETLTGPRPGRAGGPRRSATAGLHAACVSLLAGRRLLRADIPERGPEELPGFAVRALSIIANVLVVWLSWGLCSRPSAMSTRPRRRWSPRR